MTTDELSIIEKYMSSDEIKEIIVQELRGKLKEDFNEMYYSTLLLKDSEYNNNIIFMVFRDYILTNHAKALENKAIDAIDNFELAHVLGHTWDRKDRPETINKLEGMRVVNEAFKNIQPQIERRLLEAFSNKDDDEILNIFAGHFSDQLYNIFLSHMQTKKA